MDNKNVRNNSTNKARSTNRTSVTSFEKVGGHKTAIGAGGNRSSLYKLTNQPTNQPNARSDVQQNNSNRIHSSVPNYNNMAVERRSSSHVSSGNVRSNTPQANARSDVGQHSLYHTNNPAAQSRKQNSFKNYNTPINAANVPMARRSFERSGGSTVNSSSNRNNRQFVRSTNSPHSNTTAANMNASSADKPRFVRRSAPYSQTQSSNDTTRNAAAPNTRKHSANQSTNNNSTGRFAPQIKGAKTQSNTNRRTRSAAAVHGQPKGSTATSPKNGNADSAVNDNNAVHSNDVKREKRSAFYHVKQAASGVAYATGFVDPFRQTQIHLERELQPNGKYARTVKFVHSRDYRTSYDGRFHGVLNAVHELNTTKLQGDVPSLTKTLDSVKPKTIGGKVGLGAVKGGYKLTKGTVKAARSTVLAAERGAVSAAGHTANAGKRKLSEELEQTDTGKALVKANAVRTFVKGQIRQRRQYSAQKKRIKLRKEEVKLNKKAIDPKLKKAKLQLKTEKQIFQKHKEKLSGSKSPVKKQMLKQRKKQFKSAKLEIRQYTSNANKIKKAHKQQLKAEKKIAKLNGTKNPTSVVKGIASAAVSEFTNKLRNADKDNAALEAVNKGIDAAKKVKAVEKTIELKSANRKASNANALNQRKNKLKQQENKLHKKDQQPKKKRKRKRKKNKNTIRENLKQALKDTASAVGVAVRGALKEVLLFLTPITAFALVVMIIFLFVMSAFSPVSQFLLGTYTASDQNLTESVEVYTGYVNDMHKAIKGIYDPATRNSDWKNSLKALGVDVKGYKNKPDNENFVYGESEFFDYEPASYDFDPYVLWSFLCAYYYDFEKAEQLRNDGKAYSPEYWAVTDDTEELLKELFDKEYTFEHIYIDSSRWAEIPKEHYTLIQEKSRVYWDSLGTTRATFEDESEIPEVEYNAIRNAVEVRVENGVSYYILHYNYWTLEILDANHGDEKTGWYFQDKNENSSKMPELKSPSSWGDDVKVDGTSVAGNEIWYAVAPSDTGIDNIAYVRFEKREYYNEDAALYYNVKQNCTFEEAATNLLREKKGSYADAAIEYYNLLVGKGEDSPKYHGNHQCMKSPVRATMQELINNDRVFNGYGYDRVAAWNYNHCNNFPGMHSGIDIACHNGEQVLAMIDGEVTNVDSDSVTLYAKEFELVYSEGDNKKSRRHNIRITISNIKPSVEKGDVISVGTLIGNANNATKCYVNDNTTYWNSSNDNSCYIHVHIEIAKLLKDSESIAPEMLIY